MKPGMGGAGAATGNGGRAGTECIYEISTRQENGYGLMYCICMPRQLTYVAMQIYYYNASSIQPYTVQYYGFFVHAHCCLFQELVNFSSKKISI
jgi:hypothetical protein